MRQISSPTLRRASAPSYLDSSRTSSKPSSLAASSLTGCSCGCCAGSAVTTSCWPSAASVAGSVRHAAPGACRRLPPIWWTMSSRTFQCGNGCCRCRSPALAAIRTARTGHPGAAGVQRVVTRHMLSGAELEADEACGGAFTLIQRFMSAANLNIHLHCLVLDCVYRCGDAGVPSLDEVDAPTCHELHALLQSHDRAGARRARSCPDRAAGWIALHRAPRLADSRPPPRRWRRSLGRDGGACPRHPPPCERGKHHGHDQQDEQCGQPPEQPVDQ